jgi:hypothetical protein
MPKEKRAIIVVQETPINVLLVEGHDYISLTDMAKKAGADTLIYSWMRNRNTVEFLGIWEQIHNPSFKGLEFETFKKEAGLNSFHLTPKKWVDATGAIGIQSRAGRYHSGTYAHKDIALEFATWLSPEFKLYLIKEIQRLKEDEARRSSLDWNLNRALSKINYRIHTDAIKEHILPKALTQAEIDYAYPTEADMLNVALFGMTAKQWREANPKQGNLRDNATVEQLIVLSNLESINAMLITHGMARENRLQQLRQIARQQLSSLIGLASLKALPLPE